MRLSFAPDAVLDGNGESWGWCLAFLLFALVAASGGREAPYPYLTRLRVLFPAWRFFDRPTPLVHLLVRWQGATDTWSPWQPVLALARWRWWSLVVDPATCHQLALDAAVARLATDIQDLAARLGGHGDARTLVSYQHVQSIVDQWVCCHRPEAIQIEFCLHDHRLDGEHVSQTPILFGCKFAPSRRQHGDRSPAFDGHVTTSSEQPSDAIF